LLHLIGVVFLGENCLTNKVVEITEHLHTDIGLKHANRRFVAGNWALCEISFEST
jgi:hypothetical protein